METFDTIWKRVRLSVPGAPALLVQSWVQNGYRTLCDKRGWNWLLLQGQLTFQASRTFEVTTTLGSADVTSAALFLASDVGRQFAVGTFPVYTITAVDVGLNTATLDRAYATYDEEGVVDGTVFDGLGVLPATFGRFVVVLDPINQRLIPWWATLEELAVIDPVRTATSNVPRMLVPSGLSEVTATAGRPQYVYWPTPSEAGALQYYAMARPELLPGQPLTGVLAARPDVLETYALSQAARWPGTQDAKNPYFDLRLAISLDEQFRKLALQLDLRDDDQAQQSWETIPWQKWSGWAWAYDTHLLQATDATLAAYWGYAGLSPAW